MMLAAQLAKASIKVAYLRLVPEVIKLEAHLSPVAIPGDDCIP